MSKLPPCHFLLIFSIFLTSPSIAQTLTMDNVTPQIGDHFITHKSLAGPIGDSGQGITWDLSGLVALDTNTLSYETPTNHPKATFYPDATVVGINGDAGEFLDISSFAWQRLGISAPSFAFEVNYSNDPEVFLTFPFYYNKTFNNQFSGLVTSSGVTIPRTGTITVTGDGTGTLIMPYGQFNNVLRIKVLEVTTDTVNQIPVTIETLTYSWFQEGIHASIASVIQTTIDTNVTSASYFLDESIISSNHSLAQWDSPIRVSPNPAIDLIHVDFQLNQASRVQWQILSMEGKTILPTTSEFRQAGRQSIQLDVASIPSGKYILQLMANGKMASKKIVLLGY